MMVSMTFHVAYGLLINFLFVAVQWFRQRFNECFDKADFSKSRCQDDIPESATFAERLIYDRALEIVSFPDLSPINESLMKVCFSLELQLSTNYEVRIQPTSRLLTKQRSGCYTPSLMLQ